MPEWTQLPSSDPSNERPSGYPEGFTTFQYDNTMNRDIRSTRRSYVGAYVDRFLERCRGWRTGIAFCISLGLLVFLLNLSITVLSIRNPRRDLQGDLEVSDGLSTFYEGSCSISKSLSIGAHLILNILATILLGASNYCMQILASPTRDEVDVAHGKRRWLRIGVPNFQNLPHIHWSRGVLCALLAISSLPLHLLWNSAVVQTVSSNDYFVGGVTEDFALGANGTLADEHFIDGWFEGRRSDFEEIWFPAVRSPDVANLTASQCIDVYGHALVQTYGNLAVVFDTRNSTNSLLFAGKHISAAAEDANGVTVGVGDNWVCGLPSPTSPTCRTDDLADGESTQWIPLSSAAQWPTLASSNPYLHNLATSNVSVKYCLAQTVQSPCRVATTPIILYVVLAANAVKLFCFVCTWIIVQHRATREGEERLVTNGDLIASYLRKPDLRFSGRCLASSRLVRHPSRNKNIRGVEFWDMDKPMPQLWVGGLHQRHQKIGRFRSEAYETIQNRPGYSGSPASTSKAGKTAPRWHTGPSIAMWLIYVLPSTAIIVTLFGIYFGFRLQDQLFIAFGEASTQATISRGDGGGPGKNLGVVDSTFLANVPQLVVTYIYVACNSVLTTMLAYNEVSQLAVRRRGLRVSNPRRNTAQRGTYYLQLPLKLCLPLMTASTLLHWFLSESLFLLRVAIYTPDGVEDESRLIATVAYSSPAILAVLSLLAVIVGGVMVLAWVKRYDGARRMPLVATCSASLAAATCPPTHSSVVDVGQIGHAKSYGDIGSDTGDLAYKSFNTVITVRFEQGLSEEGLMWGVVDGDGPVQHATFSRHQVSSLQTGQLYT